jgi:hypothetical protein
MSSTEDQRAGLTCFINSDYMTTELFTRHGVPILKINLLRRRKNWHQDTDQGLK